MPLMLLDFKFLESQELCHLFGLFPLLCSSVFVYYSKPRIMREQQCETQRRKMGIFLKRHREKLGPFELFWCLFALKEPQNLPFQHLALDEPDVEMDGGGGIQKVGE